MSAIARRVRRILCLIPYLKKKRRVSLREAAATLGCGREDMLQDIKFILMTGVPPYQPDDYIHVSVHRGEVEISLAEGFDRPVALSLSEALGVKIMLEALARAGGGQEAETARRLLGEIDGRLAKMGLREPGKQVSFSQPSERVGAFLVLIRRAIKDRQCLEIEYSSLSSVASRSRIVRPYALVQHADGDYLIAYCETRAQVISFRIDRVQQVMILDRPFERPLDFRLADFKRRHFFFPKGQGREVTLLFMPSIWPRAAETCPMESWKQLPDGRIQAILLVENLAWFHGWLMGWGREAQLIGPDDAVRDFRNHILAARGRALDLRRGM